MTEVDVPALLKLALDRKASDLIVTAGAPPMLRLKRDLLATTLPPLSKAQSQKAVYGVLSAEQIARFEREKELDFSLAIGETLRFRANLFYQRGAVAAVFRVIPDQVPQLEDLGLPPILKDLALRSQGLILVTGPTGHGKSTTQAAMVDLINTTRKAHIITVEDPIEFLHRNKLSVVEQREVGDDTQGFAQALRRVLRQAPDVVLIGEMRDLETMSAALTAAETGHLVISTLHTNDAVQSVDRILDSFPAHQANQVRSQLSLSLLAVFAQRLIPRSDGQGLAVASELLINNAASAHQIREGKTHHLYSVMETHGREGMHTLDLSLKGLYLRGAITKEEAQRRMRNPDTLTREIAGA